jgi:Domain of unknown function (DUF4124)
MNSFKPLRVITFLALAGVLAASAQAGKRVYKWVDEKGVVHYTEQPPTTTKSEALDVRQGYSAASKEPADEADLTAEQKAAAVATETCEKARANLKTVNSEGDVVRKDEYGESHIMTAEERNIEKTRAEAAIKRHCKSTPEANAAAGAATPANAAATPAP